MTEPEFRFKFKLAINQFKLKFNKNPTHAVVPWPILKIILNIKYKEKKQEGPLIYKDIVLMHQGAGSKNIIQLYNDIYTLNFGD